MDKIPDAGQIYMDKIPDAGQVYMDKISRHVCRYCSKGFQFMAHLKRHELIHSAEKVFKCDYCNKGFNDITSLRRHHARHTGQKKVSCSTCGKQFTRSYSLKVHRRSTCIYRLKWRICVQKERLTLTLNLKAPRKKCIWKCRLLKSSAANNCLALLTN